MDERHQVYCLVNRSRSSQTLSELPWGKGPLYACYGYFAERPCVSETGALVLAIEDPDGRLVRNRLTTAFRVPAWVSSPRSWAITWQNGLSAGPPSLRAPAIAVMLPYLSQRQGREMRSDRRVPPPLGASRVHAAGWDIRKSPLVRWSGCSPAR